jgi:opacity protein-like surface antigen
VPTRQCLFGIFAASIAALALAEPAAQGAGAGQVSELPVDRMIALNNKALEDVRSSHFQAAKYWLEVALVIAETADLEHDETTARTYVHLAVVHLTGFKDREAAVAHFLLALKVDPNITITSGLETPALKSAYLQAREQMGLPPSPDLTLPAPGKEIPPAPAQLTPLPPSKTEVSAPPGGEAGGSGAEASAAPAQNNEARAENSQPRGYQHLLEGTGLPSIEDPDPPARVHVPLFCPLPFEAPHGRPLVVRCLTQKLQSKSNAVFHYRVEGDKETYVDVPMERSPKGWLVAVIPGDAFLGRSLSYYVKAQVLGVEDAIYVGHAEDPNSFIIKSSETDGVNPESVQGSGSTATREDKGSRALLRRAPGTWWIALGGGSGLVCHGRENVDSNSKLPSTTTPVSVGSGFSPAGLFQIEPAVGYQLSKRFALSIMGRYQYAPKKSEDPEADAGDHDIRTSALAGFARVQYGIAGKSRWQAHASAGVGFGTSFLATVDPHCTGTSCTLGHSDTLHGGPVGITLGLGVLYQLSGHLGVFAEIDEIATVPKFMALTELSVGMAVAFGPR